MPAKAEKRCRAWTYRRPGYGSAAAHCYLKETIKPPRQPAVLHFRRGALTRRSRV